MAHYGKEIGLLWTFLVSYVLINAADQRGKRFLIDQTVHSYSSSKNNFGEGIAVINGSSGSSGSSLINIQSNVVSNNSINNGNILLHGNVLLDSNFLACAHYAEYKDLVRFENDLQCHSVDTVFAKLRALHERSLLHGPGCMQDAIRKLSTYFSTQHDNFKGCKCTGHVFFHPERYHNGVYAELFLNDSTHGHCIPHNRGNPRSFLYMKSRFDLSVCIRFLSHLSSLPTHLDTYLDCQWEIINHYTTIIDANGLGCNCFHEYTNDHTTPNYIYSVSTTNSHTTSENKPTTDHTTPSPTHSTSTTMSLAPFLTVPYTCKKETTISTLIYRKKQTNPEAGNCHPDISDHMAPEALVINMCNVTGHSESWTRGQNVMFVCERIPLYTPVAIFFDGKYSSQGGLAGIFVGCLQGGFKMIVQECDKNITVIHVVTGGHFQLDPVNYSIIM